MTSLYSRHDSSPYSSDAEPEEYGVYWKTESILPAELGIPVASTSALPIQSTPNPKRTTTTASLPSPSASVAATDEGLAPVRSLRERKKPRAVKGRAKGKASSASPVTVDQTTLLAIGRLEKRLSARRATGGEGKAEAEAVGRPAAASATGLLDKGKGKQVQPGAEAKPVRALPTTRSSTATTQSTLTSSVPTRVPSPPKPTLQPFTSSKPGLTSSAAKPTSTSSSASRPSPFRPAKISPPVPKPAPAPPPKAAAAPPPRAPPITTPPSADPTESDDEFSSYFDNDVSFELALSQLESPPAQLPTAIIPPTRAQPPARSSARLAVPGPAIKAAPQFVKAVRPAAAAQPPPRHARAPPTRAPRPAFPIDSPASASSSVASPATVRASRDSPLLPKTLAGPTRRAPAPALKYNPPRPAKATGSPLVKGVAATAGEAGGRTRAAAGAGAKSGGGGKEGGVLVTLSLSQGSCSQQQVEEMRALAQQELDALVEEGVAEGWSEEEDF